MLIAQRPNLVWIFRRQAIEYRVLIVVFILRELQDASTELLKVSWVFDWWPEWRLNFLSCRHFATKPETLVWFFSCTSDVVVERQSCGNFDLWVTRVTCYCLTSRVDFFQVNLSYHLPLILISTLSFVFVRAGWYRSSRSSRLQLHFDKRLPSTRSKALARLSTHDAEQIWATLPCFVEIFKTAISSFTIASRVMVLDMFVTSSHSWIVHITIHHPSSTVILDKHIRLWALIRNTLSARMLPLWRHKFLLEVAHTDLNLINLNRNATIFEQ